MRAVLQRVTRAHVSVEGEIVGQIGEGLCVFLGVTHEDGNDQVEKIARKIAQLRLMRGDEDDSAAKRRSVEEAGLPVLLISQFTLYADVRKGRSPSWSHAAPGEVAAPIFEDVAMCLRTTYGVHVEEGRFGAMMEVELVNDGPFTLLIEV